MGCLFIYWYFILYMVGINPTGLNLYAYIRYMPPWADLFMVVTS